MSALAEADTHIVKHTDSFTFVRAAHWYRQLRGQGYDALSAWNGAKSTMRFFDRFNEVAIRQFVDDCAADDVECAFAQAAEILEDGHYAALSRATGEA